MRNNDSNDIAKKPTKNTVKHFRWAWLAILLLPITLCLPVWFEELQIKLIGYEGFCCMPENWQELQRNAERAKSMRLESNIIIGTGIVLAIIILIGVLYVLYKYAIPSITTKWLRSISQIVVGVLASPFALTLLLTSIMLISHNDDYYRTRHQPPRDVIYSYTINYFVLPLLHSTQI